MLQSRYSWATSRSKRKQAILPTPYAHMPQRIALVFTKHHELQKTTRTGSIQKGWKSFLAGNPNGPQWLWTIRPQQRKENSANINGTPVQTQPCTNRTHKTMPMRRMWRKNEVPDTFHRGCWASLRNDQAKQNQQSVHLYLQSTTNHHKTEGPNHQRPAYNKDKNADRGMHQGQAV